MNTYRITTYVQATCRLLNHQIIEGAGPITALITFAYGKRLSGVCWDAKRKVLSATDRANHVDYVLEEL